MIFSLLRMALGLVYCAVILNIFLPLMLLCLPSRKYRIYLGNISGKLIGRGLLWLASAEVDTTKVVETTRHFPAIYVSNHTSILDIFLGIWVAPIGTVGVAKKQVVWYPFFGLLYLLAGHLRVDRGNHAQAVGAMADMAALMKRHNLGVWLWPEGTRARDGRLKVFKKGFAHMAIATRLPIVPVVVAGAQRAWQHGSWKIHPTTLDIQVLEPIQTADWTMENIDEKIAMVRGRIEAALPPEQRGAALPPEQQGAALPPEQQALPTDQASS